MAIYRAMLCTILNETCANTFSRSTSFLDFLMKPKAEAKEPTKLKVIEQIRND